MGFKKIKTTTSLSLKKKKIVIYDDPEVKQFFFSDTFFSFCNTWAVQESSQWMGKFTFLTSQLFEIQSRWWEIIPLWVNESFTLPKDTTPMLLSCATNTWQCLLEEKFKKRKRKPRSFLLKSMFSQPKTWCFVWFCWF